MDPEVSAKAETKAFAAARTQRTPRHSAIDSRANVQRLFVGFAGDPARRSRIRRDWLLSREIAVPSATRSDAAYFRTALRQFRRFGKVR
ncbi:hypothetical protein [Caballeronia sp. 15711]|uniref:hypothetical protein n=1 Tax=Caballeronia sp. 15711 TaxID=3391029 RepID=UPI0039E706ED